MEHHATRRWIGGSTACLTLLALHLTLASTGRAECLPGTPLDPGRHVFELEFAGMRRSFLVRLPPQYDGSRPLPVVLDLHGFGSNATQQLAFSGSEAVADEHDFVLVAPNGYFSSWNGDIAFGAAYEAELDDVGYIKALIEHVGTLVNIDHARVYSTGLSNGAAMTNTLGCQAADVLAAVAPVADPLDIGLPDCMPARPISVLGFHGYDDEFVPYEGGPGGGPELPAPFPSIPETLQAWADLMACTGSPEVIPIEGRNQCEIYRECAEGAQVGYCSLEGPHILYEQDHLDVVDYAWSFFEQFSLPLPDEDDDGIGDQDDNCVYVANAAQEDSDGNCIGDACQCAGATDCDPSLFCNAEAECVAGACQPGPSPCTDEPTDAIATAPCADTDPACTTGESSDSASSDSASPDTTPADSDTTSITDDTSDSAAAGAGQAGGTNPSSADTASTGLSPESAGEPVGAEQTPPSAPADGTAAATAAGSAGVSDSLPTAGTSSATPSAVTGSAGESSGCSCRVGTAKTGGQPLGLVGLGLCMGCCIRLRRRLGRTKGSANTCGGSRSPRWRNCSPREQSEYGNSDWTQTKL